MNYIYSFIIFEAGAFFGFFVAALSMREKGYDPVSQIVGYLISGDPTYITSYNNARYLIRMFERDELIEELVRTYVEQYNGDDTL